MRNSFPYQVEFRNSTAQLIPATMTVTVLAPSGSRVPLPKFWPRMVSRVPPLTGPLRGWNWKTTNDSDQDSTHEVCDTDDDEFEDDYDDKLLMTMMTI